MNRPGCLSPCLGTVVNHGFVPRIGFSGQNADFFLTVKVSFRVTLKQIIKNCSLSVLKKCFSGQIKLDPHPDWSLVTGNSFQYFQRLIF